MNVTNNLSEIDQSIIDTLAGSEAALIERVRDVEGERDVYRLLLQHALDALAYKTAELDRTRDRRDEQRDAIFELRAELAELREIARGVGSLADVPAPDEAQWVQ